MKPAYQSKTVRGSRWLTLAETTDAWAYPFKPAVPAPLPSFTLPHFSVESLTVHVNTAFNWYSDGLPIIYVQTNMRVPDVDDPKRIITVTHSKQLKDPTPESITATVRRLLVELLTHELDEKLHMNGTRIHDPHDHT